MANLTAQQLAAIIAGQPIRQTWSIKAPLLADHSAYTTTLIEDGIFANGTSNLKRVVDAGTRKHEVWNPHPQDKRTPRAVRYSIAVDNADGMFHRKSGSYWNPLGLYDAAPAECFLIHQIYVGESPILWTEVVHMKFIGRILTVSYDGGASMNRTEVSAGLTTPEVRPKTATITSEQDGAWQALRRVFTKDDGDIDRFEKASPNDYYWDIAPYTPS